MPHTMNGDIFWLSFLGPIVLGAMAVWIVDSNKRLDERALVRPLVLNLCGELLPLLDWYEELVRNERRPGQPFPVEQCEVIMVHVRKAIESARHNGLDTTPSYLGWLSRLEEAASGFHEFLVYGFGSLGDDQAISIVTRYSSYFQRAQRQCRWLLTKYPVGF